MRTYDEIVREIDNVLGVLAARDEQIRQLLKEKSSRQWNLAGLCFELFGDGATTANGETIEQFAESRGIAHQTISVPLRVYRFVGQWFAKQTEPVPFTVAKLTVRHDAQGAAKLMDLWLHEGRPTEKEWAAFLERRGQWIDEQDKPPKEREALKRWAVKRATAYIRLLEKAAPLHYFPNKILPPKLKQRLVEALKPHVSKRGGLANREKKGTEPEAKGDAEFVGAAELVGATG